MECAYASCVRQCASRSEDHLHSLHSGSSEHVELHLVLAASPPCSQPAWGLQHLGISISSQLQQALLPIVGKKPRDLTEFMPQMPKELSRQTLHV